MANATDKAELGENRGGAVLVVDDEESSLHSKAAALSAGGFEVRTAATGAAALVSIAAAPPDLVLLTLRPTDASGTETFAAIKSVYPDIVVVILSEEIAGRDAQTREIGADLYLSEAVRTDGLLANVTAMIRHRRDKAALRESEARFARLVDATLEGVVIHDHERIVEANARFARLFGYSPEEVVGRDFVEYLAPEMRDRTLSNLRSGTEEPYESVGLRKDGTRLPIELCGRAIEHRGRRLRIKNVRDLTGREEAAAALRQSEAVARERLTELEALYRDAPVGLALLSRDMRFFRVNELLASINGLPARAHIGRTVEEVVPGIAEAATAQFRRVFQTGESVLGFELRGETPKAPGLERVWIEDYYPVKRPDGAVAYVGAIVREVTDQVRAQEALRESEERFRIAQELSLDAFTILRAVRDDTGRIVDFEWLYANPAATRILKRPADALVGRRLLDVLPGTRTKSDLFARYVRLIETGEAHDIELRYEADGIAGWFRTMAVRIDDRIAISFSDITERKRSEERLKLLAHEVDHRSKNLLAQVLAIVRMTRADTVAEFESKLSSRLVSLARVQTLLGETRWRGADLERLLLDELAPYRIGRGRIQLTGPTVLLPPRTAQSVGMALHELATNAVKYGALSTPSGRLRVEWEVGPALSLRWVESGGPALPPKHKGFGTTVVERSVKQQLGGSLRLEWEPDGLNFEMMLPTEQLAAEDPPGRI